MGLRNFSEVRAAIDDLQATNPVHARCDEASYAFLEQELLKIRSKTYDVLYPELKGRMIVPIDHEIPPGAETFAWDSWDKRGIAAIGGNDTDDPPMAEVLRDRTVGRIIELRSAYKYNLLELANQAQAGVPLTAKRAETAREMVERKIDELIAYGDSKTGQQGVLDLTGISSTTFAATGGTWTEATTDAADMLSDLNQIVNETVLAANQSGVEPDTLVVPLGVYTRISSKPISTLNQTTVLQVFLANQPWVKTVIPWLRAGYNSAGSTRNRIVCLKRSDQIMQYVIAQEFVQLAPQVRNYAYIVPCYARVGGVELHYSFGVRYGDVTLA